VQISIGIATRQTTIPRAINVATASVFTPVAHHIRNPADSCTPMCAAMRKSTIISTPIPAPK
jgi:hypothetical protein